MSTIFGQDEPHRRPKKAYFSCAIGVYFMSFFYEHPVFSKCRTIDCPKARPASEFDFLQAILVMVTNSC